MKDKQPRKVVIIHDIDSREIEKAILILRNGGAVTPAPAKYQIVTEAEKIIRAYSRTVEKELEQKKEPEQLREKAANTLLTLGFGIAVLLSVALSGYGVLRLIQFILEKF
ncbi:MAG: hypothetical protein IKW60_00850 [Clostridia bacterium]|nr:hypothetical protein [Clostridia bacterium]